jgi:glyoxylase-like metal-dependent hydrolase (beta-lactamase superfamily II)
MTTCACYPQPDVGSARADFPGGSVVDLYASAQKLLALPDDVRIFSGHDYPGEDRHHSCSSTVAEQRELNKHLRHGTDEKEFSSMRARRDATLAAPRLLHQSLQVNLRGGNMPRSVKMTVESGFADDDGRGITSSDLMPLVISS